MENWNKNKLGLTKRHSFVRVYDANTLISARFWLARLFWGLNYPWQPHNWRSKILFSTYRMQNLTLLCDFLFTFYMPMTEHLCLRLNVHMDWNTTSKLLAQQLVCATAWDNCVMLQQIGLSKVTLALMYVLRVKLASIWHKMKAAETKVCELPSLQYSPFNLWALYRDSIPTQFMPTHQIETHRSASCMMQYESSLHSNKNRYHRGAFFVDLLMQQR